MIRNIVADTNVLISAYLWKGKPRQALKLIQNSYNLLFSRQTLDELVRVLSVKFSLDVSDIYRIIADIQKFGKQVNIISNDDVVMEDPSDNVFINLAIDGKADIIVSGDSHLLRLKKYKGIEILTITEFLNRFS